MRNALAALFLLLALGACATTQAGPNGLADRDPREEMNRDVWQLNQAIDGGVIRPASEVYRAVTPREARTAVTSVFRNLGEPWSFINNILQGKPGRALRNLGRFLVNSTIGLAGLWDPASEIGIDPAPEDFGQTLAAWGVGDGGYVVLPLLGPSTARDAVGTIIGFIADPATIFLADRLNLDTVDQLGIRALTLVNARAELTDSGSDAFLESSADPYAAARSAFFQWREAQLLDYDTAGLDAEVGEETTGEDAALDEAIEGFEEDETGFEPAPEAGAEPGPETGIEPDAGGDAEIEPETETAPPQ